MSNNLYDIIAKFNAVDQQQQPTQQPKAKTKLAENIETVEGQLNEKYMGFKKTVAAVKKGGSADNPEAVAAAIGRKKYGKEKFQQAAAAGKKLGEQQNVVEKQQDESALQAYLGKKKYGEEGMKALQQAGRDGASKETMAKIRAKHDKMDEVAPPGAKAERMVKHIKKGYAKDGNLSPKEKGIAYATAWKAHKAGKVEEAIAAVKILTDSGMTAEQITEGWEDMLKAVDARRSAMQPGEKRQGAKGEIEKTSTGVKHTRRYDSKTGETETGDSGEQVKRKRGRPKKSAFEQYLQQYENILEQNAPRTSAGTRTQPTQPTQQYQPTMGTIKGGVWTADPPKKGEKGVPPPAPVSEPIGEMQHEADDLEEMMRLAGMGETLKGGQKKLDKNKNGKLDATDFAMLRGEMEEGNEFTGALDAARDAGKKEFEVDGEIYPVKEEMDEGSEMCEGCGYTMTECGCDSSMPDQEQEGRMNVSMNVSSDGSQNLSVNAEGDQAVKLAQLLKLAGLSSGPEQVYSPVQVSMHGEHDHEHGHEEMEEAKDERYHASTTPDEQVYDLAVQLKGGNGDVAGQEKPMHKHGYKFSDNPLAMNESIAKDYASIKVAKK